MLVTTNTATWCKTPYLAEETQEVTITFYISSEATSQILLRNLALYFKHYKDSEDEETVLLCHVAERKFSCTQKDKDYNLSLTENITGSDNPIKLIIVNVSKKHVGRYALTIDGFSHDRCVPCNLTLRNTTRKEGDASWPTYSVVFPILLIVVGVGVVVLILKRKREKRSQVCRYPSLKEGQETEAFKEKDDSTSSENSCV